MLNSVVSFLYSVFTNRLKKTVYVNTFIFVRYMVQCRGHTIAMRISHNLFPHISFKCLLLISGLCNSSAAAAFPSFAPRGIAE